MRNTVFIIIALVVAGLGIGFSADYFLNGTSPSAGKDAKSVLAKVDGSPITRAELNKAFNIDPAQLGGISEEQLYPVLAEQLINRKLIDVAAGKKITDRNKALREELENAKTQIRRNIYLETIFDEEIDDEMLEKSYEAYVAQMPNVNEINARHILVKEKAEAEKLIKQLNDGADFETLARENSIGPSASKGGDIGYFAEGDMVKEFSDAAFALKKGAITKTPVKTQFGWHVIKVEDARKRPVPSLDEVRESLKNSLKPQILNAHMEELREKFNVVKYYNEQQAAGMPAGAAEAAEDVAGEEEQQN